MDKLDKLYNKGLAALSRRNFLAGAGAVGAASVLAGCGSNAAPTPIASTGYTDGDILNFALNLEYLEAEFYLYAATGSGLTSADAGTGAGTTTGGAKVGGTLTTFQANFINELAYTEQEHVRALRSAMGSAAVARPNINLTSGFTGGVTAANSLTAVTAALPLIPTTFSPTASYDSFLVGAFLFEDVGVTAYNGAGPLLSAASVANGTLGTAAGIMAVEAYHGGALRSQLTANAINNATGAAGYPYPLYANRLSLLRAALGGGSETQLAGFSLTAATTVASIGAAGTFSSVVPANSSAIAYARTTDQVLHIVYGTFAPSATATTPAAGVSSGGFFPNGLNGNIKTTMS